MSKRPSFLADASKAIRPGFATAIVFSFFINLLAFVGPLYMLQVYDRVLGSRNIGTLVALTIVAGFLLIVYAALEKIRSSILVRLGLLFADKAKIPLFDTVLRGTIVQPGTNQAQALRDLDTIREFLTGTGLIAFCDAPWVPVFVAGCFILHPWFGYVAGVGALLIFALALANELLTRNQLKDASRNSVLAHSYAAATFRNADVLYAMGMLKGLRDRWSDRHSEGLQLQAGASDRAGFLVAFSKFVRAFLQVAILGVGAYLTVNQETSAGAMVAASIIMGRALAPVEIAVGQWKTFLAARSAYERISNLVKMLPEEGEKIALRPPQGLISVENILVIPPGGKEPVIREVSFALQPGEVLGIIGPNAAGKSSLARALVGVWRPAVGKVRIDGSELAHWNRDQLGPYIGYLPQDIELFSGTIAENISRFGEHDEEKLFAAAELAGVHELVQGLPDGYNTQVGEGGLALSGGQRQRIGLARALYGKPPLVILDEPNASLDSEGEAALMEAIQALKRARSTVVVISHKTAMLAAVDKLLVLAAGRVSAFGGRVEVLSRLMGGPKIAAVASGATVVRYLSSEAGECVGENNESSRIMPLHRYPMQRAFAVAAPATAAAVGAQTARTQANRSSQVRLGFAISTVATAAFIGVYYHVEVAAFLTGYNFRELASQELRKPDSVALRLQLEVEQAKAQVATQDAAQITQAVETSALEVRQSLKNEQRSEGSANELAAAMRQAKAAQAMATDAKPQRHALDEAQARAAALASELAGTRREIETQAAQSQKAVDEATKQKQAAESTIAELQQSLQQEQKKTTALMQEAKAAQAMAADAKPQRRALDEAPARAAALASELAGTRREIETEAAQSQKAVDEATKQKQAAESTIAELQQSLQQEQKKTTALVQEAKAAQAMAADAKPQRRALDEAPARAAALASELAGTRREIETEAAQSQNAVDEATKQRQAADSHFLNQTQVVKTAVTEPPEAAEAQGNAEAAKLIARASALLGQGDIGAARIVLERASETGSAKASFMLAETYDPAILTAWGTYGTRSEVTKARELYAKAHAGGIQEAKDRLNALRQ